MKSKRYESKRYEVDTYNGFRVKVRYETDDIEDALKKAHELEILSKDEFEGIAIYDNLHCDLVTRHERYANE